MKFDTAAAPHWRPARDVPAMMRQVLYALAPAAMAHVFFFGPGLWINLLVATAAALAAEAIALRWRGQPAGLFLGDGSAVVTAALLAFCLPPLVPWWVTATGAAFAVGIVKHAYGGLGLNPFNPAMAGLALLLLVFPADVTTWLPPQAGDLDYRAPTLPETLQFTATGRLPDAMTLDAVTRATPLEVTRTGLDQMRTMDEIRTDPSFGDFGGRGWEWVGNFVTLGGLWLLFLGIIRWQAPVAMLATVLAGSLLPWLGDAGTHPSPLFELYAGGTLLGAFFVATDPVTSCVTDRGRLLFGAGCGALTLALRWWSSFPDGVAFAVLAMNLLAPLIDRLTRPRVHGTG